MLGGRGRSTIIFMIDPKHTVKRPTPSYAFDYFRPGSGERRSMTQQDIDRLLAEKRAELLVLEAARATAPTIIRHLHDKDVEIGMMVGVRVNGSIRKGVIVDKAQCVRNRSWLYVVEQVEPTPGITGRTVKRLTPRTNADLYPESAIGRVSDETPSPGSEHKTDGEPG